MARGTRGAVTEIPPSRYKVVERDRRLVVIDTLTGKPTSTPGPVAPATRPEQRSPAERPVTEDEPRQIDDRSGAQILTTSPLYDLKAPRRIVMGDRFNEKIGAAIGGWLIALFFAFTIAFLIFPWLIVVPFVLALQPKIRAALRQWITARLDEVERG
ncbi:MULTISPECIES: hypothetical protein [unclassified Sphingomonas]|uniref:hypothetical protein n=1 Tax=unclassified Sphingomonas TaxID=196159 RepID=UPI000829B38C|nr:MULTISPECIES: hypothetical protein [unclassified Sphingomonas]